jgi:formate dehydrogenase major subunit
MHQRGELPDAEAGARRHRHEQHGQLLALLPGAGHDGLFRTVGYGGDSGSIKDIENAGLVLIIGSNTAESHPVLATRVKRPTSLRGQKLIVADLRKHEMAERADLFIHPKPGTDLVWLSAVTRYILDNGLAKTEFLDQWVNGLDEYRKSLEPFTLEFAAQTCGLPSRRLKKVAHMIAEASGVCILWAMGVTQHSMGSDSLHRDFQSAAGHRKLHADGPGAYPLRGHNNVQGASDHGAMPNFCPATSRSTIPKCARVLKPAGR